MHAPTTARAAQASSVARLLWGGALALVPRPVLRRLGRPTGLAVVTLRVLGLRHLAQAALALRRPTPLVLAAGAAADGLHALTAVGLAGLDRRQRRLALLDTAVAASWMVLGIRAARADLRPRARLAGQAGGGHGAV